MAINVYWSTCDRSWLLQKKPDLVVSKFFNNNLKTNHEGVVKTNKCPAVFDELHNTYNMYSIHNYEVFLDQNSIYSNDYDQDFLRNYIEVRSLPHKFLSYHQHVIFFTDEDSLETSVNVFPFMEDNNVTKRCTMVPGKIDIGRWFRKIDFAFFLKKDFNSFKIERDEVLYYFKFHTKEKINLKEFVFNDNLHNYSHACASLVQYTNPKSPLIKLENYYKMFRHKRLILEEIKKNLVD